MIFCALKNVFLSMSKGDRSRTKLIWKYLMLLGLFFVIQDVYCPLLNYKMDTV